MIITRTIPEQWENIENQLVRYFEFANFAAAMEFAVVVGFLAEDIGHHPDITFGWGKVVVKICTHDAGNTITQKDVDLALEINNLEGEIGNNIEEEE